MKTLEWTNETTYDENLLGKGKLVVETLGTSLEITEQFHIGISLLTFLGAGRKYGSSGSE